MKSTLPKWLEDITITKANCQHCQKLYIADKMLRRGCTIIFPNGKTYKSCQEYFYYCNEQCWNGWRELNPHRQGSS